MKLKCSWCEREGRPASIAEVEPVDNRNETRCGAALVSSASTSAEAPSVAPGAACAQALSDLLAAGFTVIDVVPFNQRLEYTLVR